MKKLALLFAATFLALTFCSFSNTENPPVLVKAITITTEVGTNAPIIITYNGNKIVSDGTNTFTYTGDLITRVTSAEGRNIDCIEYSYDGKGRLLSETVKNNRGKGNILKLSEAYKYTYNADGTVTAQVLDYPDGVTPKAVESIKFTILNGNLVREEHFDTKGASAELVLYEYDNKNTIYKNVTGADKLIVAKNFGENNVNNVVKITRTSGSKSSASSSVITNVYTYNAEGYPQTVVSTEASSEAGASITSGSRTVYAY